MDTTKIYYLDNSIMASIEVYVKEKEKDPMKPRDQEDGESSVWHWS